MQSRGSKDRKPRAGFEPYQPKRGSYSRSAATSTRAPQNESPVLHGNEETRSSQNGSSSKLCTPAKDFGKGFETERRFCAETENNRPTNVKSNDQFQSTSLWHDNSEPHRSDKVIDGGLLSHSFPIRPKETVNGRCVPNKFDMAIAQTSASEVGYSEASISSASGFLSKHPLPSSVASSLKGIGESSVSRNEQKSSCNKGQVFKSYLGNPEWKRKQQGISILECTCTANLSGERVPGRCTGDCKRSSGIGSVHGSQAFLDTSNMVQGKESFVPILRKNPSVNCTESDCADKEISMKMLGALTFDDNSEDFRSGLISSLQHEIDNDSSSPASKKSSASSESDCNTAAKVQQSLFPDGRRRLSNDKFDPKSKKTPGKVWGKKIADSPKRKEFPISQVRNKQGHQNPRYVESENGIKELRYETEESSRDRKDSAEFFAANSVKKNLSEETWEDDSVDSPCKDTSAFEKPESGMLKIPKSDTNMPNNSQLSGIGHRVDVAQTRLEVGKSNYRNMDHEKHVQFVQGTKEVSKETVGKSHAKKKLSSDEKKKFLDHHLQSIKTKHDMLRNLLDAGFQSLQDVNAIIQLSESIQEEYGSLILQCQDYAFKFDYENLLWKSCFHNVILAFRNFLDDQAKVHAAIRHDVGKQYWLFLQNGIQFLDDLVCELQTEHAFLLEDFLCDPERAQVCNKSTKLALRTCHLLSIFIGDLERYAGALEDGHDFKRAKMRYSQAQMLAPKNGKSYNQLAVVAVTTKNKLDALYYYARSLQASNPILSARERLVAIFQDIRKKAVRFSQDHAQAAGATMSNSGGQHLAATKSTGVWAESTHAHSSQHYVDNRLGQHGGKEDHIRDETWVFYRQGKVFKMVVTPQRTIVELTAPKMLSEERGADIEQRTSKVSLQKVNKGLVVRFLHIQCMLYTNIGLEAFTSLHQEVLSDLTTMLKYPKASSIKRESLIKYMTINIFAVHNILEKQGHNDIVPNTALDFAVVFGMDMFAVIAEQCCALLASFPDKREDLPLVEQFLAPTRVWLRWLATHADLVAKSSAGTMLDVWNRVIPLFNALSHIAESRNLSNGTGAEVNVYLQEDLDLAGFKPLPYKCAFCKASASDDKALVAGVLRVLNMVELISELDHVGKLPFAYDEKDRGFKSVQPAVVSCSPPKKPKDVDVVEEQLEEDVVIEDADYEEEELSDTAHVSTLRAQKALLLKQIQEQELRKQEVLDILERHRSQGRMLFENCPTHVVADTNCYIDHLPEIVKILQCKDFTLVVPLIVLNELDGLKKCAVAEKHRSGEHAQHVQERSRIAMEMLEDRFSSHDPLVKALTSKGTEMDSIAFRDEELSRDQGTNDDIILSCCLYYCGEQMVSGTGDEQTVIRRKVVLLTNDRNLRLKAHSRNVPTTELGTFVKMAKLI